jgi:hypothetical protein
MAIKLLVIEKSDTDWPLSPYFTSHPNFNFDNYRIGGGSSGGMLNGP